MRRPILLLLCASLAGCPSAPPPTPQASAPQAETSSPKDSPVQYMVLSDETQAGPNTVEFHVLVASTSKHDEVQKLLEYLYRHLMTRRDPGPAGLSAYVYTSEPQFKTPPRSPMASVIVKPGEIKPAFENKVALEFWQEIDEALTHGDKGWKLEKKIVRDDAAKTLTITFPYTEGGKDEWAEKLSFNQAMVEFIDTAQSLFEKVPDLRALTFVGRWKDEDVVKISLDRGNYQDLHLSEVEEQVGQLHGRAFLELSTNRGTDAQIDKANTQRLAALYKKMLAGLRVKAVISPKLK